MGDLDSLSGCDVSPSPHSYQRHRSIDITQVVCACACLRGAVSFFLRVLVQLFSKLCGFVPCEVLPLRMCREELKVLFDSTRNKVAILRTSTHAGGQTVTRDTVSALGASSLCSMLPCTTVQQYVSRLHTAVRFTSPYLPGPMFRSNKRSSRITGAFIEP